MEVPLPASSPGGCLSPDSIPEKYHQTMTPPQRYSRPLKGYLNWPPENKHVIFRSSIHGSSWKAIRERWYLLNLGFFWFSLIWSDSDNFISGEAYCGAETDMWIMWSRTEEPVLSKASYSHLILGKDAKNTCWRKASIFGKWCWGNWMQENEIGHICNALHKNQLQMSQVSHCKTWDIETARRK